MLARCRVLTAGVVGAALIAGHASAQPPAGGEAGSEAVQLREQVAQLEERVAELERALTALAPLYEEFEARQKFLREVEEIGRFPGGIPSTRQPVEDVEVLEAGQILQVRKESFWWAAEVVAVLPDRNVKVHYLGWPPEWDEIVPVDRLQLDPEAKEKAQRMSVSKAAVGLPAGPGPVSPSGQTIDADTPLAVDQSVLVEWGGNWWSATVIDTLADGTVKVHYTGWDEQWDEIVPRSRLQMVGEG